MYKLKIGLEIHVQVNTKSKLFSSSSTEFTNQPNTHINYFDLGIPGVLPKLNQEVINKAICAGKILNCHIEPYSRFDRKHYCYPDLPLGYQITQFYSPICTNGYVTLSNNKTIQIERIHIETDAGKLIHENDTYYIDYNRCGNPLLEIVTQPDFESSDQVSEFLRKLIRDLEYGQISNCNMELGNLRCDVNLSIYNDNRYSERVEMKNINSVEFIKDAIEYEYNRQVDLMNKNETYEQHTRGYRNGSTFFMRTKETAHDYRYIPCGNLPPIYLSETYINNIQIPETYEQKLIRYNNIINNSEIVSTILNDIKLCEYFEKIQCKNLSLAASYLACDLVGLCTDQTKPYNSKVTIEYFSEIIQMLENNLISTRSAKDVLIECFQTGQNPKEIVKEKGLQKITDKNTIMQIIEEIKIADPNTFNKWYGGVEKLENALVGQAMKKTNGTIDVDKFKELLRTLKS